MRHAYSPSTSAVTACAWLLAIAAATLIWTHSDVGSFMNDAAQYVSTSDTFAHTRQLATTTLYYELQHALGMPATQTVWPPGFAVLIGGLERLTGIDSIELIRAVNALAQGVAVLLLFGLLAHLCRRSWVAIALTGCYALHTFSLSLAVAGLSEPLYTVCLLAVALGIYRAYAPPTVKSGWLAFAACAAGAAGLIRYQALVCALALGFTVYVVFWRRGAGQLASLTRGVLALLPFVVVFGALVARNLTLTGTVTGGPKVPGGFPLTEILRQIESACIVLLPGSHKPLAIGLSAVLLLALALMLVRALRALHAHGFWLRTPDSGARLGLVVFGFSTFVGTAALVILLSFKTTVYTFDPRYFAPLLPLLMVALGSLIAEGHATQPQPAANRHGLSGAVVVLSAIGLTLVILVGWKPFIEGRRSGEQLQRVLTMHTLNGINLHDFLAAAGDPSSPILSNQSQLLHLAIRRATVGVPERRLSAKQWSVADVRQLVLRFHVRYLVLFRTMPLSGENGANDYILPLAQQPLSWATARLSTPEVTVLETTP